MSDGLEDLIERHLNDELSADEKRQLSELLDSDPEARRYLVEHSEFNSAVHSVLKSERNLDLDLGPLSLPESKKSIKAFIPWIITLAACLLLFFKVSSVQKPPVEITKVKDDRALTAILVNEVSAKFENGRTVDDVKFYPGNYKLTEGAVHLRFSTGADLVVEAPAELKIIDAMNAQLISGKVRAMVPPPAQGFTVRAYELSYEDIGTEFGLSVDSSNNSSELHVFDGQVNVKDSSNDTLLKKVFKGQAIAYSNPQSYVDKILKPDLFLTTGKIGFFRWEKQLDTLSADSDVIGSFPFRGTNEKELENNIKNSGVSVGKIHGARWVSGRWPGKKALLFDRDTDYVEIDVPVETDELSISMWIKIDRLDYFLNALFNSNGWEKGGVHLQVQNNRNPHLDIFESYISHTQELVKNNKISTNGWVHVVGVYSSRENYGKVYVNGVLSVEGKFKKNAIIKPGKCRLGNWLPVAGYEPQRSFKGRIDELVIWKRTLTEKEISSLVEKGRPSVLWSVQAQ
ncbi:MAG: FecR domain-containing protein [Lentisphaeraceae bacterium]|nr:FecR domain-containing protein [Lentisphaeraceae bacterium]